MSIIDEYLATLPELQKNVLEHIGAIVKELVPDAEEGQSYGMAGYKYQSRPLLAFTAAQTHLSLFPFSPHVIDKLRDQMKSYGVSKGTVRFSAEHPLPDELVKQIITLRLSEITHPRR